MKLNFKRVPSFQKKISFDAETRKARQVVPTLFYIPGLSKTWDARVSKTQKPLSSPSTPNLRRPQTLSRHLGNHTRLRTAIEHFTLIFLRVRLALRNFSHETPPILVYQAVVVSILGLEKKKEYFCSQVDQVALADRLVCGHTLRHCH